MKKISLSLLLSAAVVPGIASADAGPGCGWGTMIFKGQSGLFAHTSAATTNGTSWNQYFGLTSGTIDCDPMSTVSNEFQREIFVASNLDNLSQEMAQGGGDHLSSLATLYEIAPADHANFYSMTQKELPALLDSSKDGAKAVLATLDRAMASDPTLAKYTR